MADDVVVHCERKNDGSVAVTVSQGPFGRAITGVVPIEEWTRLVASVSAKGFSEEGHRMAMMLHESRTQIDCALNGEVVARLLVRDIPSQLHIPRQHGGLKALDGGLPV